MATRVLTVKGSGEAVIPAHELRSCGIQPGKEIVVSFTERAFPDLSNRAIAAIVRDNEEKHGAESHDIEPELAQGCRDEAPELSRSVGFMKLEQRLRQRGEDPETVVLQRVPEG